MISGYVCEHCGYSEPYGNDIGQDPAAVVRATYDCFLDQEVPAELEVKNGRR